MEFITAEQFLQVSKKVQKSILEWWEPSLGDLYAWNSDVINDMRKVECCGSPLVIELTEFNKGINIGQRIPLLTEGQLRRFIENKLKTTIDLVYSANLESGTNEYLIYEFDKASSSYGFLGKDLLQAYWQVAVKIAEEEINNAL